MHGRQQHWVLPRVRTYDKQLSLVAETTESDDAVGQLCRDKAVDAIKELVAMMRSAVSKYPAVDEDTVPAVLACLRYVTKGVSNNIELATSQGACTAARDVMVCS